MLLSLSFDLSRVSGFGVAVALVGYVTVLLALVVMYLVYINIPKIILLKTRRNLRKAGKGLDAENHIEVSGEVSAAISMALYLHLSEHDDESHVLTIKNIQRSYTPWNSRIYNQNDYFKLNV